MKVVVLIQSHPRENHRACEGIRIALGLASGAHDVDVILVGPAPFLLTPEAEEWVDGEMALKFLATLKEFIPAFWVEQETPIAFSETDYTVTRLSREDIAARLAAADRFVAF